MRVRRSYRYRAYRSLTREMLRHVGVSVMLAGSLLGAAAPQRAGGQEAGPSSPPEKNYLRTTLEIGGVMAAGLGVYIYKGERNDYDWSLAWDRLQERFTTLNQFRFDDNEFAMNNVAHPVAGALYYRLARVNGFGPLGASLFSVGGSTFWEVMVELREVASLNDLISTPTAGIAIGEALYQHQEFFRRASPSWRNSVLEKLLGGPILVNRLFGERAPARAERLDPYGFPADRAHQFRLYGGSLFTLSTVGSGVPDLVRSGGVLTRTPGPEWMTTLGVTSEISSVEPEDDGGIHETGGLPLTRLEAHVSLSDPAPTELHLGAETTLGGLRAGAIRETPAGPVGYRWLVGPATGFTMRLDQVPRARFLDQVATAHVVGLRTDWVGRNGAFRLRWTGAAYADFSSVRPLGMERTLAQRIRIERGHSVLWRNKYYYAWGGTLRSRLTVELGPVAVRYEVDHHAFEAFLNPQRHADEPTAETPVRDTRTYRQTWFEVRPLAGTILGAGLEYWRGTGTIGTLTVDDRESRFVLRVTAAP